MFTIPADIKTLASRIEGANAQNLAETSEVAARLFPDSGATAQAVAGGVAAFVGADIPLSYAVGLGLNGAVTDDDIAQVVEFYRARGAVPRVDVCPLADGSLLDALRRHGFKLHWFVNVLGRGIMSGDDFTPLPDEIYVREAVSAEAEQWAAVVDAGFSDGAPLTEARRRLGLMIFQRPATRTYFALINGIVVGAGALFADRNYAGLAATAVLPDYRGRGVHTALIRKRLADARKLGCDLAGFFADPGSVSQRNAERHGFRPLYTKAVMKAE